MRILILAVALSFGVAIGQVISMQVLDVTLHDAIRNGFFQITGIASFAVVVSLVGAP